MATERASDGRNDLRARLEALEIDQRRLGDRVRALEALVLEDRTPAAVAQGETPLAGSGLEAARALEPVQGIVGLGGRTVLALAGAYLIRALTDGGILSPLTGVVLGLAYALAWYALADRAAAKGERVSASFHGLASGLMAYPLLWETSTRLGILPPAAALIALVGVFAVGSAVAARNQLGVVAWFGTLLALGTIVGLLVATRELLGAVVALLVVAALLEGLASRGLWRDLRWPAALALDGGVGILVWLCSRTEGFPEGYPPVSLGAALAAALALPAVYLVSIAASTLRLDRAVGPFEVLQGATALAIGFGGGAHLVAAHGGTGRGLAVAAVVLGTLCYGVAFAFVERREGPATNFYFYSTAAGVLTLLGSRTFLETGGRALSWCSLALVGCWLGRRFDRMTLRYHGAAYLGAAGLATGLLGSAGRSLVGDPRIGLLLPTAPALLAAAATLACSAVLAGDQKIRGWRRVPHVLVATWASWSLAGTMVPVLAQAGVATPAAVATLRTGVLAALAVALAILARQLAIVELSWLVYPVLVLGGFKLVAEDVPSGRAAALFLSFVLYGIALILAPRLLRTKG